MVEHVRYARTRNPFTPVVVYIIVLWTTLVLSVGVLIFIGETDAFPIIATTIVAVAALITLRVSEVDLGTRKLQEAPRLWWPYWLVILVGSIATNGWYIPILHIRSISHVPYLVLGLIIAPIAEEVLFRGFLLGKIYETYGGRGRKTLSVAASSLIFGLTHVVNYIIDGNALGTTIDVISSVAFGLLVGFAYVRSWNIYGAIVAHMIGNVLTYS